MKPAECNACLIWVDEQGIWIKSNVTATSTCDCRRADGS